MVLGAAIGKPCVEDVYRAHWASLVRIAWIMSGSRDEAQDIVQDAFVRLGTGGRPMPDNPKAYMRRVVVNLVRDKRRRSLLALHRRSQADQLVLDVEQAATWDMVQSLPIRQRQALVLRYHDDLSIKEIAEALDCAVPAAKSLLHRGLKHLRKEIEGSE